MTNNVDQKLVDEARGLFAQMVRETDKEKRVDLKIEINDICLRGKFDYDSWVYSPMLEQMRKG
jgi:hypothetical protein